MTGHAFQVLLTDEQVRSALRAIRPLLSESGHFAFETRNPLAREWETWRPELFSEVADEHGLTVRMARRIEIPFDGSCLSFSHTFTCESWDKPEVSHSTLRFLEAGDLNALLDEEGFTVEEQYGHWDRSALTELSPEIITVARPGSTPA